MNTPTIHIQSSLEESQLKGLTDKGASVEKAAGEQDKAQLKKAAKDFESFMYGYMFKNMYSSVQKSEFTKNSMGNEIFMGLFLDEACKSNQLGGENGIAAVMLKQYEKNLSAKERETLKELTGATERVETNLSKTLKEHAHAGPAAPKAVQQGVAALVDKLSDTMTSDYGVRKHPVSGRHKMHEGIDFGLKHGTDLHAPVKGTVVHAGPNGGYGNTVIIDHGNGWMTKYAHLSEISVKKGERISKSALLGKVGSTGVSTGPHLHLEVLHDGQAVDPKELTTGLASVKKAKAF